MIRPERADSTGPEQSSRPAQPTRSGDGSDDGYVVRKYEPDDREGFLRLHETVFDGGSEEWFAWKYEDNPYLDEVAMFVATIDGDMVGARPFLGYRMRAGDYSYVALQTGDTMVHPDHRRKGLFSRMTERSLAYYADREPAFMVNVPNAISRGGYLDLGCEVVGELPTHYRLQRPGAFLDLDGVAGHLGEVSNPIARGYYRVRDAMASVPPEVTVVEHAGVPSDVLASLYRRRPPDAIHAVRDETFFDYRFGNPQWNYRAYTARLGATPVAGIVTGTRTDGGTTETDVMDVLPLAGDEERDRALRALVARALRDHADSDVVAVRGSAIPASVLSAFGFLEDRSLPLSLVATPTVAIAAPIPTDGDWRVAGRDLRKRANWHPTFVEHNTR